MQISTHAIRRWLKARRGGIARRVYERGISVDTGRRVDLDQLGYDQPDRRGYTPCGWRTIKRALDCCEIGRDDIFVDLGCGMGRVVVQAARRDFGRVMGVEISPDLAAQARRYLREAGAERSSVEVVVDDATKWQIPDDVTVVFLNNPFGGDVLQAVVNNLVASLDRAERFLQVVYVNPREPERLIATGRFEVVKEERQGKPGGADDFLIMHHVVPAG